MQSKDQLKVTRLPSATNPLQARNKQQVHQQEGNRCQTLSDYLDAGIGYVPRIGAKVWVEAADFAHVEAILRQHLDCSEVTAQVVQKP
jgi:hypothetical protein